MTIRATYVSLPTTGEAVRGDGALVRRDARAHMVVALVDGVGHGSDPVDALCSDGISSKFRLEESLHLKPAEACRLAIERHRKHEDDSTIVMADMGG